MSEPSAYTPFSVPATPVNSPSDNDFPPTTSPPTASTTPTAPTLGKQLWKNAVRNVTMRNALALAPPTASVIGTTNKPRAPPIRQRTISSVVSLSSGDGRTRTISEPVYTRSRLSALVPKLIELEATHDLAAHSALVRHMQFSPDGTFLATSSWDKTSVIFRVGTPFTPHRTLAHPQGFVGQVAWSPTGNILLTKMARGIKVWTAEDGVCKKTINRNTAIETVTWFPSGDAFLSIEDSTATKMDINGNVLDQYEFANMKLLDVAITPDATRLVGVGPLLQSPEGLQPSKSRVEKRLVVYNVETKQIENMTPVLEVVRDITLAQTSRNGLVALISYEHKAPPQLWKLELVKDRETNKITTSRLSLRNGTSSSLTWPRRHTYMPKGPVDFAGSSYFGGQNNELVMCAAKAGDIHIWDRESGALLHSIRAQANGGDLTCIAWNHSSSDPFMFATGSHDGGVRVWTRHPAKDPNFLNTNEFPRSTSPYGLGSYRNGFDSMLSLDEYPSEHDSPERDLTASACASQTRLISDGDPP
ncbi:putative WD repeat-containing protein [Psilocybe cubensis]|uniref:WD repeat-containing protein n=1 Tax=Psilocybe cubensis TaxID=181762 RepID=A0ACB8GSQ5_PSICU|nr:putative WD repeat-containing protein [Psilocybe cubensis]KAH9478462.1 putative WD repeat-containing protein [Psilocybe cubensis]